METVGLAGFNGKVVKGCADFERLQQVISSPDLVKASWRERYEVMRRQNSLDARLGERFANAMTDAVVRLIDVADARFHKRLSKALQLSGAAREKELAELKTMTGQGGLGAVGVWQLPNNQFGNSLRILMNARDPGPFEAVGRKRGEVMGGWMTALETCEPMKKPERIEKKQIDSEDKSNDLTNTAAYEQYMSAYNAMTKLMAAGKGDTPEGKEAYRKFKKAKDEYNASQQ